MKQLRIVFGLLLAFAAASTAFGQAIYTADGPGSYTAVGATFSAYQSDYGKRQLGGESAFVDAHLYRRIGVEAKATWLNLNTDEGIKQRTYLIGPKIALKGRTLRPYVKLLAGRGEFDFPFGLGSGSYFVAAPGAGLDWHVGHTRLLVRIVDFEYQIWNGFSYGAIHPYGISTGLSVRVW
jgi:hypothetical protein